MENTTGTKLKIFWEACIGGDLTLVDKLLKAGEDVNQVFIVKGKEWTPLMIASLDGNKKLLKLLLKKGAHVNLQERNGCTALLCASENGHLNYYTNMVPR